jgi:predicted nucleic acid-binding protein
MEACEGESLYLSVLSLGEVQKGIDKLPPSHRRNTLQRWIDDDLAKQFSGRIIPVDKVVAVTWGHIHARLQMAGTPIPVFDGLLCATALTHNLTMVTRNIRDFAQSGVRIFNPWNC